MTNPLKADPRLRYQYAQKQQIPGAGGGGTGSEWKLLLSKDDF